MDVVTPDAARGLALLATLAVGLVIGTALAMALRAPANIGLSIQPGPAGGSAVTWVAPDGPAWDAGIRPGDIVESTVPHASAPAAVIVRHGRRRLVLGPAAMTPRLFDLLDAGLGVSLLLCGAFILVKGQDRAASRAFWRMTLLASVALALVPAGIHGVPWALVLDFAALCLVGPALLHLTWTFPVSTARLPLRALVWGQGLLLLPVYALCWRQPVPLFPLLLVATTITLAGYTMVACVRVAALLFRLRSAPQRAQLQWLTLGLVCGFMPLVLLTLLPLILVGHPLVPAQGSSLALGLLPLSIGTAIVRTEFFGITSLMHRRTLRLGLIVAQLAGVAAIVGLLTMIGPQGWGWPAPATAAGAGVLTALGCLALRVRVTRWAERLLLHDVYDPTDTLVQVSADLTTAPPHEQGQLVVTRMCAVLNLDVALLRTPHEQCIGTHPRSPVPAALHQAMAERAQALLADPPPGQVHKEDVQGLPVVFCVIRVGSPIYAVLCCGPKHNGDAYTRQDRALLDALSRYLALLFFGQQMQAQLEEQCAASHTLEEEGAALTRHEVMVLTYASLNLSTKEIARLVDRSTRAVEKHLTSAYRKLGVQQQHKDKRQEAVRIARQKHLLPPDTTAGIT